MNKSSSLSLLFLCELETYLDHTRGKGILAYCKCPQQLRIYQSSSDPSPGKVLICQLKLEGVDFFSLGYPSLLFKLLHSNGFVEQLPETEEATERKDNIRGISYSFSVALA
jgi:hypothetical protein